jgi:hypothetical protein
MAGHRDARSSGGWRHRGDRVRSCAARHPNRCHAARPPHQTPDGARPGDQGPARRKIFREPATSGVSAAPRACLSCGGAVVRGPVEDHRPRIERRPPLRVARQEAVGGAGQAGAEVQRGQASLGAPEPHALAEKAAGRVVEVIGVGAAEGLMEERSSSHCPGSDRQRWSSVFLRQDGFPDQEPVDVGSNSVSSRRPWPLTSVRGAAVASGEGIRAARVH